MKGFSADGEKFNFQGKSPVFYKILSPCGRGEGEGLN
jgi:hypothetical protein